MPIILTKLATWPLVTCVTTIDTASYGPNKTQFDNEQFYYALYHFDLYITSMVYACRVYFPAAGNEIHKVNVKKAQHIYQAGSTCVFLRVSQGSTVIRFNSSKGE